ncbi:MAG TPA: DUF6491 family protein [Steroidobacteraceae bacterium]|jgi:hypothetical protein|nr:DUF6491 family protein [Steroidobacteraceae bacterium]
MKARKRQTLRGVWLLGALALLAGCSSIPLKEREQAERARVEAYAGQPIDHFTWLGRYDGWKPLGPQEALVWTTPSRAYLIKVQQPCEDLRFATHIGLTSTLHTVYSRGLDYVKVRGWRCPIEEIRPVDYGRLQADLRKERQTRQAQAAATENRDETG